MPGVWRAGIDGVPPVPQGAEAVERLNESGELRRMLKPYKVGRQMAQERKRVIDHVDRVVYNMRWIYPMRRLLYAPDRRMSILGYFYVA